MLPQKTAFLSGQAHARGRSLLLFTAVVLTLGLLPQRAATCSSDSSCRSGFCCYTCFFTCCASYGCSTCSSSNGACNSNCKAGYAGSSCNSCASGYYVSGGSGATTVCSAKKSGGSSCSNGGECQSNRCQGGYCCASALLNPDACKTCGLTNAIFVRNGYCSECISASYFSTSSGSFSYDNYCTAVGALAAGSACSSSSSRSCSSGLCKGSYCCSSSASTSQCNTCTSSGTCSSCSSGYSGGSCTSCASGYYVSGGSGATTVCSAKKSGGSSCSNGGECQSNRCQGWYCCNSALLHPDACNTCGRTSGYCSVCISDSYFLTDSGFISFDYYCTAQGALAEGSACSDSRSCSSGLCKGSYCCSSSASISQCNTCTSSGTCSSCSSGYSGGSCTSCASGYYVSGGSGATTVCSAKKSGGSSCSNGGECESNRCQGEYCCNSALLNPDACKTCGLIYAYVRQGYCSECISASDLPTSSDLFSYNKYCILSPPSPPSTSSPPSLPSTSLPPSSGSQAVGSACLPSQSCSSGACLGGFCCSPSASSNCITCSIGSGSCSLCDSGYTVSSGQCIASSSNGGGSGSSGGGSGGGSSSGSTPTTTRPSSPCASLSTATASFTRYCTISPDCFQFACKVDPANFLPSTLAPLFDTFALEVKFDACAQPPSLAATVSYGPKSFPPLTLTEGQTLPVPQFAVQGAGLYVNLRTFHFQDSENLLIELALQLKTPAFPLLFLSASTYDVLTFPSFAIPISRGTCPAASTSGSGGISGTMIGGIIAGVAVVALVALGVAMYLRNRNSSTIGSSNESGRFHAMPAHSSAFAMTDIPGNPVVNDYEAGAHGNPLPPSNDYLDVCSEHEPSAMKGSNFRAAAWHGNVQQYSEPNSIQGVSRLTGGRLLPRHFQAPVQETHVDGI